MIHCGKPSNVSLRNHFIDFFPKRIKWGIIPSGEPDTRTFCRKSPIPTKLSRKVFEVGE